MFSASPQLELDGKAGSLHLLLAPKQIFYLLDLLTSLNLSGEPCQSEMEGGPAGGVLVVVVVVGLDPHLLGFCSLEMLLLVLNQPNCVRHLLQTPTAFWLWFYGECPPAHLEEPGTELLNLTPWEKCLKPFPNPFFFSFPLPPKNPVP